MKDKEKQIEEMAKDLEKVEKEAYSRLVKETQAYVKEHHRYNSKEDYSLAHTKTVFELTAEEMTKLGWVKLPEDSVVLSKEEYEKLKQCEKDKDYAYKGWDNALDTLNEVRTHLKQASKETAEKYHKLTQEAINKVPHAPKLFKQAWREKNNEIAKQFGVEIKE